MRTYTRIFAFLSVLPLCGCATLEEKIPTWNDLAFWRDPAPVVPVEERWCYKTLGRVDCYESPQNTLPERLVGVQPKALTPVTREEHAQALLDSVQRAP